MPETNETGPNRPSSAAVNTSVPPSPSGPDLTPEESALIAKLEADPTADVVPGNPRATLDLAANAGIHPEPSPPPHPLTTPTGVIKHMRASRDGADWGSRCDEVRAANGGGYPGFWYNTIILGGELTACQRRWGK